MIQIVVARLQLNQQDSPANPPDFVDALWSLCYSAARNRFGRLIKFGRSGFKRLSFNRASAHDGPIREPHPDEHVRFMNCTSPPVHSKSAAECQATNNNQEEAKPNEEIYRVDHRNDAYR